MEAADQLLLGLEAGVSTELLLLDVHGHVLHAPAVQDDGERTWLVTEAGDDAERLAQFLDSMRFMLRVEVAVRDYLARADAGSKYPGIDVGVRVDQIGRSVTVRLSAPLDLPLTVPGSPSSPTVGASSTAAVTVVPGG